MVGETPQYSAAALFTELNATQEAWCGPISHHYGAVVNAICSRAERGRTPGSGGSTFSYVIDDEHPLKEEVSNLFERTRQAASELRRRTSEINRARSLGEG